MDFFEKIHRLAITISNLYLLWIKIYVFEDVLEEEEDTNIKWMQTMYDDRATSLIN